MKEIKLTNSSLHAMVDDEDFYLLSENNWQVNLGTKMVQRCERVAGKIKTLLLARVITNAPKNMQVDHKNHNKLDNQKSNLRVCTRSQNGQNRTKQSSPSHSKYKGVSFWDGKWKAKIRVKNVNIYLGTFKDEISAAKAYDKVAKENFGEFAFPNFNQ